MLQVANRVLPVTLDIASLLAAIVALAGAVVALWRKLELEHGARARDQRKATELILALVQKVAELEGRRSPRTPHELERWPDDESTKITEAGYRHAIGAAREVLNDSVERLVRSYLKNGSDPP